MFVCVYWRQRRGDQWVWWLGFRKGAGCMEWGKGVGGQGLGGWRGCAEAATAWRQRAPAALGVRGVQTLECAV